MSVLSASDKKELLALKQDELSVSKMSYLFGKTTTKTADNKFEIRQPRFNLRDTFKLAAGEYINEKEVETTVGSFLFNKIMIEGMLEPVIPNGYYNEVIDKKGFGKLKGLLSDGLMMQKITVQPTLVKWLKQYEFYAMKATTIFSPSYTRGLLEQNSKVQKEKKALLKGKDIENLTSQEMGELEDTLVAKAKAELQKDPGMTLFDSGARGSFENDYKNMNLMLGPVARPGKDGEFDMVTSNYIDGLQKDDLVAAGNIAVNAIHPKAIGTQKGGYLTKQYYAAYQSIQCDEDGTDCGTTDGIELVLTNDNVEDYYFQNIIDSKNPHKYTTLTKENKDQFLNKKVKIRSTMYCKSDKMCSVCVGRRFYLMGIKNIGLTSGRVTNTLLNASMKNFHVAKLKFDEVDIDDLVV